MRLVSLAVVLLGVCLVLNSGCAGKIPEETISGTVTFKGKPLTIGGVIFCSDDDQHSASGDLDASGNFTLSNPLPLGNYRVGFYEPLFNDLYKSRPAELTSPLPKKYLSYEVSGVTYTIEKGVSTAKFDL